MDAFKLRIFARLGLHGRMVLGDRSPLVIITAGVLDAGVPVPILFDSTRTLAKRCWSAHGLQLIAWPAMEATVMYLFTHERAK
jgi:hypothetical protein